MRFTQWVCAHKCAPPRISKSYLYAQIRILDWRLHLPPLNIIMISPSHCMESPVKLFIFSSVMCGACNTQNLTELLWKFSSMYTLTQTLGTCSSLKKTKAHSRLWLAYFFEFYFTWCAPFPAGLTEEHPEIYGLMLINHVDPDGLCQRGGLNSFRKRFENCVVLSQLLIKWSTLHHLYGNPLKWHYVHVGQFCVHLTFFCPMNSYKVCGIFMMDIWFRLFSLIGQDQFTCVYHGTMRPSVRC